MFLNEILRHKRQEVAVAKQLTPLSRVLELCGTAPRPLPFAGALRASSRPISLIAEVKKASPSAGVIRPDFDFLSIANEYADAGADCLSVLTDERFFQGHLTYLMQIKQSVALPLLRKDFTIEEYQVYEARAAGADAILLIVAALEPVLLKELHELGKSLGMDVLVETHTEKEMEIASSIGADLIGINTRDLKSFVTDLSVVERVAILAPPSALLVAESGIKTREDVQRMREAGASAILVGETLMRSPSISTAIANLLD